MTIEFVASNSVSQLKGVGPKVAATLQRLHITTLQDLLFHLPIRYEDRTRVTPIAEAKAGDHILIEGRVTQAHVIGRGQRQLVVTMEDESGAVILRFFHFTRQQLQQFKQSEASVRCFGEVRQTRQWQLEFVHPAYELFENTPQRLTISQTLTPVYPVTQGLGQVVLRRLIQQALTWLEECPLKDCLPMSIRERFQWPSINDALRYIHHPPASADQNRLLNWVHPMQQCLAFEELLAHYGLLRQAKQKKQQSQSYSIHRSNVLETKLKKTLPFELTAAQQRVIATVQQNLSNHFPMYRLVQGDVGSGKTIVAAMSALSAIESGHQVALMAPTEILVTQHYQKFLEWFNPLGIEVALLTGSQTASEKKQQLEKIASGQAQMVIGTHALFQRDVVFQSLAFFIVDEQHRFGVEQRLALFSKGQNAGMVPHQLVMTATPIPRTLYMTAYADLDCSVIDELPPGRQMIQTVMVSASKRDTVIERLISHCQQGKQAYWVCTLIEESDVLEAQAAVDVAEQLTVACAALSVGLVHGRMKPDEKATVMQAFQAGELDLLVATTVIEVGVDVPNASLMVIENPERLGLSQLHQLRGRVGRGRDASFCVLLYQSSVSAQSIQRLQVMRESQDGFYIAEQDLKLRGPGEILGVRQSGLLQFRMADLVRDEAMMSIVQEVGEQLIQSGSGLEVLIQRWLSHQAAYLQG